MKCKLNKLFVLIILFGFVSTIEASSLVSIKSAQQFISALKNLSRGEIIEVANGTYDLQGEVVIQFKATEKKPVIIRAKNRGKATIAGKSQIIFSGAEYITLEGFEFISTKGTAAELRGSNHIRITRNIFHLKEQERGIWVFITGIKNDEKTVSHHNRIDHNLFEKKSLLGNFIAIEGTSRTPPQVSQYDRIDHNYLRDIGPRVENVLEAIRVGWADLSLSSGYTLMEDNLFERCDGDPEYISIKSSDNIIRHNTFRECLGSLSLRHGNRNLVEGNYILGNNRTGTFLDSTGKTWILGTGGVRFYGDDMHIINNYFEGLTGTKWDATFAITNGDAVYGDGQPLTKHFRIRKAVIAFNTIVNNTSGFEIGYDGGGFQGNWWHQPPVGIVIANNIIVGSQDTLIKLITKPQECTWKGNIAYASKSAVVSRSPLEGVEVKDPKLVKVDGVWKPSAHSPALKAAEGRFPTICFDIEMKSRKAAKDVGAFQMSKDKPKNWPLTAKDVGPDAK